VSCAGLSPRPPCLQMNTFSSARMTNGSRKIFLQVNFLKKLTNALVSVYLICPFGCIEFHNLENWASRQKCGRFYINLPRENSLLFHCALGKYFIFSLVPWAVTGHLIGSHCRTQASHWLPWPIPKHLIGYLGRARHLIG
jgi:hypothetical protein